MRNLKGCWWIGVAVIVFLIDPKAAVFSESEETEKDEQDLLFLLAESYTQHRRELQITQGIFYSRSRATELEINEDGGIDEKKQKKQVYRTPLEIEWGFTDRLEGEIEASLIYARKQSTLINTGNRRNTKHIEDIEDLELGLRYLLVKESERCPAISISYSLELPTGDFKEELGHRNEGHEVSLAISRDFDRWVGHFNLGFGVHFDERKANENNTQSPELDLRELSWGVAAVRRVNDHWKLFVELFHEIEEEIEVNKRKSETELRILPGFSYAFERGPEGRESEWEFALGFPIGITDDAPVWGAIFKVKYETDFS